MNTLKINNDVPKNEVIKLINKFRLQNKNKWYQVELHYSPYIYKMKIYNTWVQLCYQTKDGIILNNNPSIMDMNISQFKDYLNNVIK